LRLGSAILLARRALAGRPVPGEELRGRRYIRGAVIGVAMSLVPLIVVLVAANGMIEGITERYIEVGTYHLQARQTLRRTVAERDLAVERLRSEAKFGVFFRETQGPAIAVAKGRTEGILLRAIEPSFLEDPGTRRYFRTVQGEASLDSSNEALIGEALAKTLGIGPGDVFSIVTTRTTFDEGAVTLIPRISAFRVRGIVSAGYRELDALWVFVNTKAGDRIMPVGVSRSLIGIKLDDPFVDLEEARERIEKILPPEWNVVTWMEVEFNLYKSFSTTRSLLLLIMALTVGVAAINVGSALVMLVLERRRDIAILKSAGAAPGFIGLVFLLAGVATGGLGTMIGIALGAVTAWRINEIIHGAELVLNWTYRAMGFLFGSNAPASTLKLLDPAYYLETIPVRIASADLFAVGITSLVLCILASLIPALRAARLPPLDVMRKT
jgi:lipoprotein-releasing system permease protein